MHVRRLPPFADLGSFLDHLAANGQVADIAEPVDLHLEVTEIHRRVIAAGGPVLRFAAARRDGRSLTIPLVANLFGTIERVAAGLGTDAAGLGDLGRALAWLRSPRPPADLAEWRALFPVIRAGLRARPRRVGGEPRLQDADADLGALPVQTCWPGDAGPLVTWPIVVTRPPGDDRFADYNLGVYRMQVLDDRSAILRWLPMRGGATHHRAWAAAGQDMPVAVVIGADPATMLAAVMPAPESVSELSLAGILGGRRSAMVPCRTIPLHVPRSAEIVLEGTVSATRTAMEGPFGDHTGYYNSAEPFPVFSLRHMRMRGAPVYLGTFTGRAPDEPSVIGEALGEVFKPLLLAAIPDVRDIWLPPATCSYRVAVVAIDKRHPGQARRVMMGLWSLLPQFSMTKFLIVVDEDIDIRCWDDVMWAVATRSDPSRDLVVVERTPIDHLDFASPLPGLGGKLGIDATRKIGAETGRTWMEALAMPPDLCARVTARWSTLFPDADPASRRP